MSSKLAQVEYVKEADPGGEQRIKSKKYTLPLIGESEQKPDQDSQMPTT
jgi:hypothetical protein